MNHTTFHAFTTKASGRLREIITDIGVSLPFIEDSIQKLDSRIYQTKALWDTGATNCVVTKQTALSLNLKPISVTKVFHADGDSLANVYRRPRLAIGGAKTQFPLAYRYRLLIYLSFPVHFEPPLIANRCYKLVFPLSFSAFNSVVVFA